MNHSGNAPRAAVIAPTDLERLKVNGFLLGTLLILITAAMLLTACGGGGGGGDGDGDDPDVTVSSDFSHYQIPRELSAVPAKEGSGGDTGRSVFSALYHALYSDDGTDYTKAKTRKYVEERTLAQFDVLEDVLTAVDQTRYYEEIGNPPYKAMVTQVGGDEGGQEQKSLQAWVVEVDIVDTSGQVVAPGEVVDGVDYNVRIRAWIQEPMQLVRAQFVITREPEQNQDGTYDNYGEWQLNVQFGDTTDEYFAAACEIGPNGESIIRLHEIFGEEGPGSGGLDAEIKAIMYRSQETGYGRVSFPDWEALYGPEAPENPTSMPLITASYAYNDDYLAIQPDDDSQAVYKDRNQLVEMTHRYGVFESLTGDDIMRSKQFGFPIVYVDDQDNRRYGYYGAWQGRHQLWIDGSEEGQNGLPEGTAVTQEVYDDLTEPESYVVGKTFDGVLVKRTYQSASLADIQNIPVEIWIDDNYQLLYNSDDATWYHCTQMTWNEFGPSCDPQNAVDFDAEIGFGTLVTSATDSRKQVFINGWDETAQADKRFVYLPDGNTYGVAAGFYEAEETFGDYGPVMSVLLDGGQPIPIDTGAVPQLWVWIGGSVYVEYRGEETGWVQKELLDFDYDHWQPTFGDNDTPFTLPAGRELYVNMEGANYVVQKDQAGGVTVQLELQTAVNPINVDDIVPLGTVFQEPWNENGTTYELVTDPESADFLTLVYKTVAEGAQDMDGNPVQAGDAVLEGRWGLQAVVDGVAQDFNWEYSQEGWCSVTYLMQDGFFVLLDDPVRFDPITIQHNGSSKTLSLQYDGWMMGLPDMYRLLDQNDWVMTTQISEKIINLPAGTPVTESLTGIEYVLKPLEISQFLLPADSDTESALLPDLTQTDGVDLDSVPVFVDHNMPDMPAVDTVKYTEGMLMQ